MSLVFEIAIVIIILAISILLMRIRLRVKWSSDRKWIFLGLGHSGPEFDLIKRTGTLKLFGITLKHFPWKRISEDETPEKITKPGKPQKRQRQRSWRDLQRLLPVMIKEFISFLKSVLSSLVVEELQGEVRGGFDSPSDTGMAYGYYQAALAIAPGVTGRLHYVPDWEASSLSASARIAVALPLYKLLWRTVVLAWRLPLRDIYKLAIGTRKGGHDVQ